MATYTTQNPDKVERLVLYAPAWIRQTASLVQAGPGPLGAYRTVTREQALGALDDRRAGGQEGGAHSRRLVRAWADATWATDPDGAKRTRRCCARRTASCRTARNSWAPARPYYDPAKITVPTLLVVGEWDRDTPPYMAQTMFPLLVNSPGKRFVMLAEGTHTIMMEKNRAGAVPARCRRSSTRRASRLPCT